MENFADLTGFYTLLWIILLPTALALWIGKKIAGRKGREILADRLGRISRICAVIGAAAVLLSAFSLMGGMSAYFSSGH